MNAVGSMTKHQMAEGRKKDLKKCGVCGDNALGSNFNAITCESCKAFFRRNALKKKDFKCPFDGNCRVDVVTRRFCQKCRLKKCFDIGMKKEWIMSEEEKKAKRDKIEKNRQKRTNTYSQPDESLSSTAVYVKMEDPDPPPVIKEVLSPLSTMSPLTPQTPGSSTMAEPSPASRARLFSHQPLTPSDCEYSPPAKVVIVDSSHISSACESTELDSFSNNGSSVSSPQSESLWKRDASSPIGKVNISDDECLIEEKEMPIDPKNQSATSSESHCVHNSTETLSKSVYAKAIAVEFSCLPIRREGAPHKELSMLERNRLEELVIANEVLKMPLACDVPDPSLLDVINMTDHAIRRLIKMSKKINAFKSLCQDDQIALLKGGCTELMILRSVMTYDSEKDCWRHGPNGSMRMSIKVDVLKEAKGNVYQEHKRFINSFLPEWRSDENIMLLLSAVALFTPERPNVIHKDVIQLEQTTYYYLLRRYLETILDGCDASSSFLSLVRRIEQLHILNENHVRVYLNVNPKDVEPLLIEIFDLKH